MNLPTKIALITTHMVQSFCFCNGWMYGSVDWPFDFDHTAWTKDGTCIEIMDFDFGPKYRNLHLEEISTVEEISIPSLVRNIIENDERN